jgi:DNA-binding MarR family transcriptional regulator
MAADRRSLSFDRLQYELAVLTRRAEHRRLAGAQVSGTVMERSSFLLLAHLAEHGEASLTDLSRAFTVNASTITRQVAVLLERGYVTRTKSPHNHRVAIVRVTDLGRSDFAAVRAARTEHFSSLLADWRLEDVEAASALLDRLNTAVFASMAASPAP